MGRIEVELRAAAVGHQRRFAFDVLALQLGGLLRKLDHARHRLVVGQKIGVIGADAGDARFRLLQRKAERLGIDLEQHVADLHALAFAHHHLADLAGDVRRHQHLLRADIGVVGGHVAAAGEIDGKAGNAGDQRDDDEQDQPAGLVEPARERLPLCVGRRRRLLAGEFEHRISHCGVPCTLRLSHPAL